MSRNLRFVYKKHIKVIVKIFLVITSVFLQISCNQNIFYEMADQSSDEALILDAKLFLSKGSYDVAIKKIQAMSAGGQAQRITKTVLTSIYAASCGLKFFEFMTAMGNMSTSLFISLMNGMPGSSAASLLDCISAEATLTSIGAIADRTMDENLFMVYVSLAKMGSILNFYADTDGDGVVDGTFQHCSTIPDGDIKQFVTSLSNLLFSLTAAGASLGGASISGITDICSSLPPNQNFCNITEVANVTANHITAIRGLIGSKDIPGIGSCNQDLMTCVLSCP